MIDRFKNFDFTKKVYVVQMPRTKNFLASLSSPYKRCSKREYAFEFDNYIDALVWAVFLTEVRKRKAIVKESHKYISKRRNTRYPADRAKAGKPSNKLQAIREKLIACNGVYSGDI